MVLALLGWDPILYVKHSSTNGVLKSRYKKINIFVYILGRIPPTSFVSSARWSPILQADWLWCHSMQMVCTEYAVCVECTVCLFWKKLHRIKLHKYYKKTSWTVGGRPFFIVRHSVHYQIGPGILRFSVHILITILVLLYLCTNIPLCRVCHHHVLFRECYRLEWGRVGHPWLQRVHVYLVLHSGCALRSVS